MKQWSAWIPWSVAGLLFCLCGFLAFLQNHWLDQVSRADRQRLHQDLQDELELIRRDFDGQIRRDVAAVTPTTEQIRELGAEKAVGLQFVSRKPTEFRSFAIVKGFAAGGPAPVEVRLPGTEERLALELDLDYLRRVTFPVLFKRYLDSGLKVHYQAEVVSGIDANDVIFETNPGMDLTKRTIDGSIGLLDLHREGFRMGPPPGIRRLPPPGPPPDRWRLLVHYEAGALDAVVSRARWQNAGISAGVLALILATGAFLVSSSRRAHQLAELQFNFVTGVSHELRTPIAVIRTAAFNLRKLASQPTQVERYGRLIEGEGEKLSALVEQVLAFASARSGRTLQARERIDVNALIEQTVRSNSALTSSGVTLEKHIEAGLPSISGNPLAIKNALNNLLDNALKYGVGQTGWIGLSARSICGKEGAAIEIRVADHGPGVPAEEQAHIFEPFFRCRRAVEEQVHGTGLGLSLVRSIMEAHGGSASVESGNEQGATMVLTLPAAKET